MTFANVSAPDSLKMFRELSNGFNLNIEQAACALRSVGQLMTFLYMIFQMLLILVRPHHSDHTDRTDFLQLVTSIKWR